MFFPNWDAPHQWDFCSTGGANLGVPRYKASGVTEGFRIAEPHLLVAP
ncbi:hypothetical protein [Tolypothrix bouteillei]